MSSQVNIKVILLTFYLTLTLVCIESMENNQHSKQPQTEEEPPAMSDLSDGRRPYYEAVNKRPFPRFHHSSVYWAPTFPVRSTMLADKRFQPFHPLARFRGLSLTSPGGPMGIHSTRVEVANPMERSTSYQPFFSSMDPVPRPPGYPAHPVPSDSHPRAMKQTGLNQDELDEDDLEEDQYIEDVQDRSSYTAGELLHYLSSVANNRGLSGKTKEFRFGLTRK